MSTNISSPLLHSGEDKMTLRDEDYLLGRLGLYLAEMGMTDSEVIEQFVREIVSAAKRKISVEATSDEFLRRAFEEALRRLDLSIKTAFDLSANDKRQIAHFRAETILSKNIRLEDMLFSRDLTEEDICVSRESKIVGHIMSTPPEVPMAMPEQHISFIFA